MRGLIIIPLLAVVAACESTTAPAPVQTEWSGVLAAEAGFPGVTGTFSVISGPVQSTVTTNLAGAAPGAVHPWHVHFGTCDNDQGIVGDMNAYPHLTPDATGGSTQTATVNYVLQPGQLYFVNVHASPDDLPTIVACGPLLQDQ